jgi:hypothetical protein
VLSKYTRKNLTTCQQDVFATCLWQACQQVVTMLLFYQVATRLLLTTCWQVVELQDDNKLLVQLATSLLNQQPCTHVKNLTTCQQDVFATGLWQTCQQVVTMLLFYQVVTRLSLTTCWKIVQLQNDNKLLVQLVTSLELCSLSLNYKSVELNNLVASCQQADHNLSTSWEQAGEHILMTSCWNSIATSLPQVCYNLCVFTCVYHK